METRSVYPVELELRQEGERPVLTGRFTYGAQATIASTGRVRKERFRPRAFEYAVRSPDREVNLLYGHDLNRPLARKLNGSLELEDAEDALTFRAILPPEADQPSWVSDALAAQRAGLIGGLSPGFNVPPASAVAGAEELIPEPGNPGIAIRFIRAAVLFEMSLVSRPAYPDTLVDLRAAGLYVPHEPDPRLRLLL